MPHSLLSAPVQELMLAPNYTRHGALIFGSRRLVLMPGATLICHMLSAQQGDTFGPPCGNWNRNRTALEVSTRLCAILLSGVSYSSSQDALMPAALHHVDARHRTCILSFSVAQLAVPIDWAICKQVSSGPLLELGSFAACSQH